MNKKLFIAYKAFTFDDGGITGNIVLEHIPPVETVKDIQEIEDCICVLFHYDEIVITNWKRMEDAE